MKEIAAALTVIIGLIAGGGYAMYEQQKALAADMHAIRQQLEKAPRTFGLHD